jgi:hypothetical protein
MSPYQWTPQGDATVRAEHRYLDYGVFPAEPARPPARRCYADPMPLDRPPTRYPKRWSRAKRKASRAAALSVWSRLVRGAP